MRAKEILRSKVTQEKTKQIVDGEDRNAPMVEEENKLQRRSQWGDDGGSGEDHGDDDLGFRLKFYIIYFKTTPSFQFFFILLFQKY